MKAKKLGIIIISISIAAIIVVTFFINFLAFNKFDNILEQFIDKTADTVRGDDHGAWILSITRAASTALPTFTNTKKTWLQKLLRKAPPFWKTTACFLSKRAQRSAFSAILRSIW